MKARMRIPAEKIIYINGVDARDGWKTARWEPGDMVDDPNCWKLCAIRDHDPRSPTFGELYAEPADPECQARAQPYLDAMKLDAGARTPKEVFIERFGLKEEPEPSAPNLDDEI